jgi:hypothetical protein
MCDGWSAVDTATKNVIPVMMGIDDLPDWWRTDVPESAQHCFSRARRITGVNEHGFSIADNDTHKRLHPFEVRVGWEIPYALADLSKRTVHTPIILDNG